MRGRVYVETSVVSYLTSRLSHDLIVASHQQITQEWWVNHRNKFALFVSQTVLEEAAGGDREAAQQRLSAIENLPLLEITSEAIALAKALVSLGSLPAQAEIDALHIAIAVTNSVDYLLTWNCKHLANAVLRNRIERVCRLQGYDPVIICTPEELLED